MAFLALWLKSVGRKKLKMLVIAPVRVCYQVWSSDVEDSELRKWNQFRQLKSIVLHGPDKDKLIHEDADIYVINPEGLEWLIETGGLDHLLKIGVKILCVDELSKFKYTSTKRFKWLKPFLKLFERRWGLTGSPTARSLLDLFGQAYVLDSGKTLGPFITHYRMKYFMQTGYGGYTWVPQEGAEEKIYKAMSTLALRMSAEDHLDMPQLINKTIWVDLPQKTRKLYDDMFDELIIQVGKNTITAANAAVASSKCRQIASGGLYRSSVGLDGQETRQTIHLHDEKTEALSDLIEELQGAPLLIAYEFKHDLERLQKAFGTKKEPLPYIGDGVSMKHTTDLVREWNRGNLPLLAGHPQSMGHGLNLQAGGHHICWYTLTWDYELYDQFIRRLLRQGQQAHVFNYMLMARDTVDVAVHASLGRKRRGQDTFFEALKQLGSQRDRLTEKKVIYKDKKMK